MNLARAIIKSKTVGPKYDRSSHFAKHICYLGANHGVGLVHIFTMQIKINFFKWAKPGLLFVYFRYFQTNIFKIFTTNKCEKCPSSIGCRDLNSQPSDYKSPPLTTRPGLPPKSICLQNIIFHHVRITSYYL